MQIKTITTVAGVNEIDFGNDDSQTTAHFYWFKNLSDSNLYVSAMPRPVAGEDNVAELSAKGAASVETDEGKVYVLGAGKVEIHRTNSKFCPFELPSTGSGGGGGGSITVDSELSETSENPLQNKATTAAINEVKTELSSKSNTGHTHLTSEITDFPDALPANGGNADTVDNLHANDFMKVNRASGYDCNTLYDAGLYLCTGGSTNTPNDLAYGTLLVMPYRRPYGNVSPDYCAQIFILNGDVSNPSMWYRTSLETTWNEWKRSCDGGNADTIKTMSVIGTASDVTHTTVLDWANSVNGFGTATIINAYGYPPDLPVQHEGMLTVETGYQGLRKIVTFTSYVDIGLTYQRSILRNEWRSDWYQTKAGNADTLDGYHADDFYSTNNKPYVTGEVTGASGSAIITTNHGFTPSAVFWWMISQGRTLHSAHSFDTTSFTLSSSLTSDALVNYIIFR